MCDLYRTFVCTESHPHIPYCVVHTIGTYWPLFKCSKYAMMYYARVSTRVHLTTRPCNACTYHRQDWCRGPCGSQSAVSSFSVPTKRVKKITFTFKTSIFICGAWMAAEKMKRPCACWIHRLRHQHKHFYFERYRGFAPAITCICLPPFNTHAKTCNDLITYTSMHPYVHQHLHLHLRTHIYAHIYTRPGPHT